MSEIKLEAKEGIDQDTIESVKLLGEKYKYGFVGGNFRLDAIQAAILSVKLPHLDQQHQQRQLNAEFYNKNLHHIFH